ncbi:MAG: glycine-rich domain-containing protein [Aeromonas veronii]
MDRITNPELPEGEDPREFIEGDVETPATPLSIRWLNAMQTELISLIEASGQTPSKNDLTQILKAIQLMSPKGTIVDEFTESGTWRKPVGAKWHTFIVIGGGAGGASGEVTDYAVPTRGGPGGGGGAIQIVSMPARMVDESCAVAVSSQPAKGGAPSNGISNPGKYGASSSIRIANQSLLYAEGAPSTDTNTYPQGGPGGGYRGVSGLFPGGKGALATTGAGNIGNNTVDGVSTSRGGGAGGGGSGGGLAASASFGSNGGPSGQTLMSGQTSNTGQPGMDAPASLIKVGFVGAGGIGGGSNPSGNGGRGSNGVNYGGGGGGGGAAKAGSLSGAGGDGAPGIVVVVTYF